MKFDNKVFYIYICLFTFIFSVIFTGCNRTKSGQLTEKEIQKIYKDSLKNSLLDSSQKFTCIDKIAQNYLANEQYQDAILLLTEWVEENPDDIYNAYWLLMTAHAYLSLNAEPVAEYYFDKILQTYPDLYVKDISVHYRCLQNLIQISKTPTHKIKYFNDLINRFPQNINTTELYLRLALEYQNDNQWEEALKTYTLFIQQPDASTIQIPGEPDAYNNARHLIDFNRSAKDWTFESLSSLEKAVKKAISNYDARALDKYRAKVNFFTMSWKQDAVDVDNQEEFSMANWMTGNSIRFSPTLDEASTSNEAYLKTWGWNDYVSVWYFYFRKVDFPLDPEINGNWEWAGIYIGNKL